MDRRSLLLTAPLALIGPCGRPPPRRRAKTSALPKIGVCAHPRDRGGDAAKVVAALRQVGITRVRSDCPWNAGDGTLAWCLALAKVGITLCLSVNEWAGQPNVNAALGLVRQIVKTYPGSVDAIEGANEVNNNPQSWAGSMDPRNGDMSQRSAARAGQATEAAEALEKLFADETTAPVLDPGRGRTETRQLWAYPRDDRPWNGPEPPGVAYVYAPDRKAERRITHLNGFRGVLQMDGYAGYRALAEAGDVRLAFFSGSVGTGAATLLSLN